MSGGVKESDWKLFRNQLPLWQQRAMEQLCHEYQEILSDDSKTAYERFCELDRRIGHDREMACVKCSISRSTMDNVLHELLREHAITLEDLGGMSGELQERMKQWADIMLE